MLIDEYNLVGSGSYVDPLTPEPVIDCALTEWHTPLPTALHINSVLDDDKVKANNKWKNKLKEKDGNS